MWLEDLAKGGAEGILEGLGTAISKAAGAFKADPTKVAEFEVAIDKIKADVITKLGERDAAIIASVNATMQAEAKSEHWIQWTWRPLIGMTVSAVLINNYILLPYLVRYGIVPIVVPETVWGMLLAVLGVAAWTRGQAQIESIRQGGK